MQDTLMQQGIDLMLFGMGSVCVFLTLLVIVTGLMSSIIGRFFPEAVVPLVPSRASAQGSVNDPKLVAIIQAAIDKHRK